jgi:hypothetical protein
MSRSEPSEDEAILELARFLAEHFGGTPRGWLPDTREIWRQLSERLPPTRDDSPSS